MPSKREREGARYGGAGLTLPRERGTPGVSLRVPRLLIAGVVDLPCENRPTLARCLSCFASRRACRGVAPTSVGA